MTKYLLLIPAAFVLLSSGCAEQKKAELNTTESGLQYVVYTKSKGQKLDSGNYVYVSYRGYLDSAGQDGKKFDASYDRNQPIIYQLGAGQIIKGWQEAIPMFTVGDSATIVIPPALGYGDKSRDPIPPNSTLRFHLKVEDTDAPDFGMPFSIGEKDTLVDEATGIKYAFIRKTDWSPARKGQNIAMHYRGTFLDGNVFDESISKGKPFTFRLGTGGVIKGWDIIGAKMNVGDKVRVIIPSDYAYGDNDYAGIPGGSTLVFDIVMIGAY